MFSLEFLFLILTYQNNKKHKKFINLMFYQIKHTLKIHPNKICKHKNKLCQGNI
jgi:hypothetical protein